MKEEKYWGIFAISAIVPLIGLILWAVLTGDNKAKGIAARDGMIMTFGLGCLFVALAAMFG